VGNSINIHTLVKATVQVQNLRDVSLVRPYLRITLRRRKHIQFKPVWGCTFITHLTVSQNLVYDSFRYPQIQVGLSESSVESGAGAAAGYPDGQYQDRGATVVTDRSSLIRGADALFMVRGPGCAGSTVCDRLDIFPKGQLLIGFFNPLMSLEVIRQLAEKELVVFAMELIPRISRAQSMDALSSMTSLAGYKAVLLAANALPKMFPLMMTAAGSLAPARVFYSRRRCHRVAGMRHGQAIGRIGISL
jgi:hypothetical protein